MNINSAIIEGSLILSTNSILSARLDSELLMSKVIKKDRKDTILLQNEKLSTELYNKFKNLIYQRLKKKQIAYL